MFFTYRQNNSGGHFVINDNIAQFVIIEAESAEKANNKAEQIGLYFNGFGDCECCGSRWSKAYDKGTKRPAAYGESIRLFLQYKENYNYEARIYYKSGQVVSVKGSTEKVIKKAKSEAKNHCKTNRVKNEKS